MTGNYYGVRLLPFWKTHAWFPLAALVSPLPSLLGPGVAGDRLQGLAVGVVEDLEELVLDEAGPAGDRPALVVGDLARCFIGGAACSPGGAELGPAAAEGCLVEDCRGPKLWSHSADNLWFLAWWLVWLSTSALAAQSGSHLAGCAGAAEALAVERG